MRICVMGAGIGGLTAAHRLTKMGHKVDIFERNPSVGGLARTMYLENGDHSEYCWHVFANTYTSLISIMKDIPFNGGTTADQLKPVANISYGSTNKFVIEHTNPFAASYSPQAYFKAINSLGHTFTIKDLCISALFMLFAKVSTPERFNQPYYDDTLWADFMDSLSPDAKIWIIDTVGIFLGLEPDRVNVHTILHLVREVCKAGDFNDGLFYCLNGPTSERWFEPWLAYLVESGVSVNLRNEISQIQCEEGEIKEITICDGNGNPHNLSYDVYINGLDVQSFANLLYGANSTKDKMTQLSHRSYQLQPQVTFYLKEKVHFGETNLLYLPDTPWGIMFRPESTFWDVPLGKGPNPPGEIISAGIGSWHINGMLYGKPARQCSKEELAREVWAQIQKCTSLTKYYKTDNNGTLSDVRYQSYDVWYSYSYKQESGELDTWEPKFSNNVGTLALRPSTWQPDIRNLVHATAYTRTETNIFNMNSAAEAGIRAANYIQFAEAKADAVWYKPPKKFWRFCQRVDQSLYKKGYLNPIEALLRRL